MPALVSLHKFMNSHPSSFTRLLFFAFVQDLVICGIMSFMFVISCLYFISDIMYSSLYWNLVHVEELI